MFSSIDQVVFVFRNDKRFFLKTQNRREVRFLLSNLQAYMDHLEKYPHSLMVRFLGKSNSNNKHNFESIHAKNLLWCTSPLSPSQRGPAVAPCNPLKGKRLWIMNDLMNESEQCIFCQLHIGLPPQHHRQHHGFINTQHSWTTDISVLCSRQLILTYTKLSQKKDE